MILLVLMLATMNLYFWTIVKPQRKWFRGTDGRLWAMRPDNLRPPVPIPAAYKENLIGLLSNFSTLARWHGLEYWMCAGTLLGAVRDGGLIPWDDGGDLCAPRETIDRLYNDSSVQASMRRLGLRRSSTSNNTSSKGPIPGTKWIGDMLVFHAGDEVDAEPAGGVKISFADYIHRFSFVDGPVVPTGVTKPMYVDLFEMEQVQQTDFMGMRSRTLVQYRERENLKRWNWEWFLPDELYPLRNYTFAGTISLLGPSDAEPYLDRAFGSWLWGQLPTFIPTGMSGVRFGQTWRTPFFTYQHNVGQR